MIARQVRRGLAWSFAGNTVNGVGNVLLGILLAHLLEPKDYGVFAVALLGLLLILSLNDVGLAATIVRWPGNLDRVAPTATTIIAVASLLLYAGLFVLAPAMAAALNAPGAAGLLRVLGLGVVIDGLFAVPTVLLTRNFQQDRRTWADVTGFAISAGVMIVLAIGGFGAWSLVWGRLVGNLISGGLIWVLAPARYWPSFRAADARELLRFGLPLAAASLLTLAIARVDYVVVGRILGPVSLGFYLLATNLSTWPVTLIFAAVRRVSLAGFSRLQQDMVALRSGYSRALALLMVVILPVSALMAVLAIPLVTFLYGQRWSAAATVLQFLALAGVLRMAFELTEDLLVAGGRPKTVMYLRVAWLGTLIPALSLGAWLGGLRGVGIGYLVDGLIVAPAFLWAAGQLRINRRQLGRLLTRPLIGAALAAVTVLVIQHGVSGSFYQLAAGGLAATAVYLVVVFPMRRLVGATRAGSAGA